MSNENKMQYNVSSAVGRNKVNKFVKVGVKRRVESLVDCVKSKKYRVREVSSEVSTQKCLCLLIDY